MSLGQNLIIQKWRLYGNRDNLWENTFLSNIVLEESFYSSALQFKKTYNWYFAYLQNQI